MSSFAANILYKTVLCSRITQSRRDYGRLSCKLQFFSFKYVNYMLTYFLLQFPVCHSLFLVLLACSWLYFWHSQDFIRETGPMATLTNWESTGVRTLRLQEVMSVRKAPLPPDSSPWNHFWTSNIKERFLVKRKQYKKQLEYDSGDHHSCFQPGITPLHLNSQTPTHPTNTIICHHL